jgi:hypothetical protein
MSKIIAGELRIWTDGKQAHACIDAETSAGPVLFQASVPLALVRAKVLRSLSRRGYPVASRARKTEAIVGFFGRRLALRRLARAVPRAFVPGGLTSHLSVRRFAARRLPGLPGRLLGAPERFSPSARLLPPVSPAGLPEEPIEGVGYRELVGVAPVAIAAVTATPKVMAGAKLLSAAATNPKALAQVKRITSLAKAGSPAGKAALNTLKKANIFRKRKRAAAAVAAAAVPASAALAVRSATARSVTPAPSVPPPPRGQKKRRRFFSNWQRGVE